MTCDPCGAIARGRGKRLPEGWGRSIDGVLFCSPFVALAKVTGAFRPGRPAPRRFSAHTRRIR